MGAMPEPSSPPRSRWSWSIGRVRGIELRVHATFVVLLVWFGLAAWQARGTGWAVAAEVIFIVALFACVVLHELGHALTAQRFGIRTRDITLLPIGGVARLERMPTASRQELLIALAGPAVNVVIGGVLLGVLALVPSPDPEGIVPRLALANLALAAFNLLPAFPMDGGRVLRAVLAVRMGRLPATRRAAAIGRGFAVLFILLGLWVNTVLLLVGVFVWLAAGGELMDVELRAAAEHQRVADAMVLRFTTVRAHDPLQRVLDELLAGAQQDFPVVDERGRVQGMIYRSELMRGLAEHGEAAPASAVMCSDVAVLDAAAPLAEALERFEEHGGRALPVAWNGRLVGLLTPQNLGELFAAREALGHELHRGSAPA
jgi:Zn-dependent protease/CBS domain-containing protein